MIASTRGPALVKSVELWENANSSFGDPNSLFLAALGLHSNHYDKKQVKHTSTTDGPSVTSSRASEILRFKCFGRYA